MALHGSLFLETSDAETGQLVKNDEQRQATRAPMGAPARAALLIGLLAGAAVLMTALSSGRHSHKLTAGGDFISDAADDVDAHRARMHALDDATNKTGEDLQAHLGAHLRESRTTVRESVIKLKKEGKSIKEIKEAGYTKQNLGCHPQKSQAGALERCLEHLKSVFTPLELDGLLEMEGSHELQVLVDLGVAPKTGGWKKGAAVVVCFSNDEKEGCFKKNVSAVSDDEVKFRHLELDAKTGTTEKGGYKFQAYDLEQWAQAPARKATTTSNSSTSDEHRLQMHALDNSNKTGEDFNEHLRGHLRESSKTVREAVIKLKKSGKSIQEIKDAGYTKDNLGCKPHESAAEALERCLEHLQGSFTPLELDELLEMESSHELRMLVDAGVAKKTSGWKKGAEVLVRYSSDKEEGCFKRNVTVVSDGKVKFRSLELDAETGAAERGDFKFQAYDLEDWE